MRDAVIVGAVRTPIGKRNGAYAAVHPVDLSAHVLRALAERTGIDPAVVDDVIWGCVQPVGPQSLNMARNAVLAAGWPESVPGTTLDRQCGSSQQTAHFAAAVVMSGQADVVVAGGAEVMSVVPMGSVTAGDLGEPYGPLFTERYPTTPHQGLGAEAIAEKWGLSRQQLDEFSLRSHQLAAAAIDGGAFAAQYVEIPGTGLTADQGLRRTTTLEALGKLPPAFQEGGVIHAGNSSQISDGAGALLITTSEKATQLGLKPLVRLHSFAVAGSDPVLMLTGPIPATAAALSRANLSIGDIGAFEINEAFASVPLAWQAETGAAADRLNPLGGAIAVGHPLGGSGAILMTRLVHHMVDNGIRYGLQSMCEGGGMANATVLELL
ncbi:thiolase family protein [Nocardia sp. alder85J]|uniref:thiolase family protein n=1 Tax=Nocardia sp. alder85J TaxID=2862949 RepID=UPI001CD37F98|nr:thiolase family protein [Nocardia sp. alder85J]MCX4096818.1 thiolase family protein [Nocardia sp. alder85J]